MSKESKIILIALLLAFLAVFVEGVVVQRSVEEAKRVLTEEVRVGDGHVNNFVGQQHDHMMQQGR